jgi:hypothetical protein
MAGCEPAAVAAATAVAAAVAVMAAATWFRSTWVVGRCC